MYQYLLITHSIFRWLVLGAIILAWVLALHGFFTKRKFSKWDNVFRHSAATLAHIQLIIGIFLYIKSPLVKSFWSNIPEGMKNMEVAFFAVYHFILMHSSVVLITFGSALAKRKVDDIVKFETIIFWYSLTFLIIFISIPWPFSPFANRSYIKTF